MTKTLSTQKEQTSYAPAAEEWGRVDSVNFIPYPNPFINSIHFKYTLLQASTTRVLVYSVLSGRIVYSAFALTQEAGEHIQTLILNVPTGPYVMTLNYGNKLKSSIIYKN